MKMPKRNILLNPGPATTTDSVKQALVVADICPREKEFCELVKEIRTKITKIVSGEKTHKTVLIPGSGTAVMDSVINSTIAPNKKFAIIINGAYGERMAQIAEAYKIDCVKITFEWGEKIDFEKVEQILKSENNIASLAVIHHETSTGILNNIKTAGELSKKYKLNYIVDAMSSFAGIPIDINENNIDYLLSSSNKCIQGMAGCGIIIAKETELEKIKNYPKRSYYLDLYSQYKSLEKTGQSLFTPPVQVLYSLKQAINEYFKEGGINRYNRYTNSWKTLRKGLIDLGLELLLPEEDESHILLTILYPENPNFSFEEMHDVLYKQGYTIYPGKIGNQKTFRLANLGDIDSKDIKSFLKCLKKYLNKF